MFRSPATRLSLVLTLITVNILFLANLIGFIPDESKSALKLRKSLCESLALQFSSAAEKGDFQTIQHTLQAVVVRNEEIRSAAIRTVKGKLIAIAGEHLAHWDAPPDGKSTPTHVHVPVYWKNKIWAMVEIRFAPLWESSLMGGLTNSFVGMLAFVTVSTLLCFFFTIKRTLRELDPTTVVPERVQKAFDVLQEGVLILDEKEQILMANSSFANLFGKSPGAMIGLKGSELGWLECPHPDQVRQLPWIKVLQDGEEHKGASLSLKNSHGRTIKLSVNAAMVSDNAGKCRGALLTFDDITQLEEKNFELTDTVEKLRLANEEIHSKSLELETLANRDPLTLCLNRRSLAQQFKAIFNKSKETGSHLSCVMLDIDLFKSVNDNYGHAVGDQVIKAVADVLKSCTRETDIVGRYGGEEFCVVLPNLYLDKALQIAERFRLAIEEKSSSGVNVTVSVGVSTLEATTNQPDDMINQADKALYAAKKGGRNMVVTWGPDFDDQAGVDCEAQNANQGSPAGDPADSAADLIKLQRRVMTLEGLLEKRTLELKHFEMYDFKTGLPTHSLFEDRIAHEIARGKRKNYLVAVLSMTVETIKRIHATLGHKAAEQLVANCGQRLNGVLREDIDTVAVMDGFKGMASISFSSQTEFSILLTDIKRVDHVTWVMKRLLDAFKKPFQIHGNEVYASAFIGVSIYPHDGQSVEELCRNATNACSHAQKHNKEDRYLFYSPQLNEMAVAQLKIENLLHDAIEKDELRLHYQPKIDSTTGRIIGFEALLRWQNAELGTVPPNRFIPVAEQSGLIDTIGHWVIYQACQQLRTWQQKGLAAGTMAVNVSGVQLRQPNLTRRIQNILDEFDLDTHLLEIELTESSLVDIRDNSFAVLKRMEKMGLRVTMDDFGTGYSSLSYLRNMPLACIKIDRSFISDLNKDENANKLIASIVSMAHELGLEVVAEGVEEKHQADYLMAQGCEYLQGYYYSRPLPQDKATELLLKQPTALTA